MFRKKAGYLIPMQIRLCRAISCPRVLIGYLYGFWLGLSMGMRYAAFSMGMGTGVFESYLLITNDSFNIALALVGFFILIADAPFIDSETHYVLIRSGGSSWRNSMVGYILVQAIIYEFLVLLGGMLPCLLTGDFTLGWSNTMEILAGAAPKVAIIDYKLPILDKWMLSVWNAPIAFLHSFLLTLLYKFFLGLVIFSGNLNTALPVGNLTAIGIHFIGMLVMSDFVPLFWPSMVAHSMLQYHVPGRGILPLGGSYFLFVFGIIITLFVLKKISLYTDYRVSISQRTW